MAHICYWIVEKRDRKKTYQYIFLNPTDALTKLRRCKGRLKYVIEAV